MSAFVVPMSHITLLAVYAHRNRSEISAIGSMTAHEIGAKLYAENVRSVNARYQENDPITGFEIHEGAVFRNFSLAQIAKSANCLAYQSCEHDAWEKSEASEIVRQILALALVSSGYSSLEAWKESADYKSAEWVIDMEFKAAA